jgi:rare lipoprotein A
MRIRSLAGAAVYACVCATVAACASTPPPPPGRAAGPAPAKAQAKALPKGLRPYAQAWPAKPPSNGGSKPSARVPRTRSAAAPTPGLYKIGAPYEVRGIWYVPAEQPGYEETGIASWYGDEFHGRPTANGEVFDASLVTGAHTTLPMPSLVEVTNLETGKTIQVRLNDRGPFSPGRIIDLSRAAAEQLGFRAKGTASVRVRYLGPADGLTVATREPARRGPLSLPGLQPRDGESGWAVQAGAFSHADSADRVAATLKAAGRTSVRPLERDGRTLYRVLVGPWPDQDAAAAARSQVAELGFSDAKVIAAF